MNIHLKFQTCRRRVFASFMLIMISCTPMFVQAQANLEINTPSINAHRKALSDRRQQLAPYYESGAVGIARDGTIVVRDASAVPLPQRATVTSLVSAQNAELAAIYREIALANGKPEWEAEIRNTFARGWIDKAPAGWYVQNQQGQWVKK